MIHRSLSLKACEKFMRDNCLPETVKAYDNFSLPSKKKFMNEAVLTIIGDAIVAKLKADERDRKRTKQKAKKTRVFKINETCLGYVRNILKSERLLSTILERSVKVTMNPGIVRFNVGGKVITASTETLAKEPSSLLYAIGSGLVANYPKDENGTIFIDRNPKYFEEIIEYLRSGWYNKEGGNYFLKQLYNEANYFGITSLVKELGGIPIDTVFDLQPQETKALTEWCEAESFTLLHRASRDGFESKSFHDHCDNIKGTLTIVKTVTGYIFGGYTEVGWKSKNKPALKKGSGYEFLYSLRNPQSTGPIQFPVRYFNKYNSVLHCNRYGPSFGADSKGHCEIHIAENPNTTINSHVLGFPAMYDGKGYDNKIFCGSDRFQVEDYEVFLVTNQRTREDIYTKIESDI